MVHTSSRYPHGFARFFSGHFQSLKLGFGVAGKEKMQCIFFL